MEDKTICWVFEGTVYRLSLGVMVINLYLKKKKTKKNQNNKTPIFIHTT